MSTEVLLTSGTSWTVPDDCSSATVECIGGGQGGGEDIGGAGGDYAKANDVSLTPGDSIAISIGTGGSGIASGSQEAGGDTTFGSVVLARGGGSASTNIGDVIYEGGMPASGGGGGGGAAGPNGNGEDASGDTGGTGDAGSGGAGGDTGEDGSDGTEWTTAGSGGGGGAVSIGPVNTWVVPNDGTTTDITVLFQDENGNPTPPTAGNLLTLCVTAGRALMAGGSDPIPEGWELVNHQYPPQYDINLLQRTSDGTETGVNLVCAGTQGAAAVVMEWVGRKVGTSETGLGYTSNGLVPFGPTGTPADASAVPLAFAALDRAGEANTSETVTPESPWDGDMDADHAALVVGGFWRSAPDDSVSGSVTIAPVSGNNHMYQWITVWLEPLTPAVELDYTFPDATIGGSYTASISAWNVDGATGEITLTVTGLQSGWSVGTRTGSGTEADPYVWPVTGTTAGDPGTASVHIVADNGNGQTATADVDVTVNAASSGTAPSVVAHNATVLSGATIDFTIRKPATGNVWMLFVQGAKGTTVTMPAGQTWTQKDAGDSGGPTTQTWWHVVDGSETADPSFGADNTASGLLVELQDANTSNPFHNFARNNITGLAANTAYNLPSLTPTIANTLAIGTVGTFSQSGSVMTPATGWTTLDWSTLSAERIAGIYQVQDGSLAAVTGSLSYSNSGSGKGAAVLALIAPK